MPPVRALGDGAILVPRPAGSDAAALLRALRREPAIADVVVTEDDVGLYFHGEASRDEARAAMARAAAEPPVAEAARWIAIGVRYDGPDLDHVARASGLAVDEVIARHAASDYVVAMLGFLPGFAYLRGLDPRLHLPRREVPRPRIAAGSVAIGGPYAGVYPFDSPGGWHLLGSALDLDPFALEAGDRVRFVPA